jgi:hypothetical protein
MLVCVYWVLAGGGGDGCRGVDTTINPSRYQVCTRLARAAWTVGRVWQLHVGRFVFRVLARRGWSGSVTYGHCL